MYIKNISIKNYGAIEDFDFKFEFNEDNQPNITVLVGENGTGKTLLMSNIIHSLIELKRVHFNEIKETDKNMYYRAGYKDYVRYNKKFSYVNIDYSEDVFYTDLMVRDYDLSLIENLKNVNINGKNIKENGFYNNKKSCEKNVFSNNVYLYFPVDRYYIPQWLNKDNSEIVFSTYNNFVGKSNDNMIKQNILLDIENWIMDVIIDKLIYEEKSAIFEEKDRSGNDYKIEKIYYFGKNNNIQNLINLILRKILPDNEQFLDVRIGVAPKSNRRISIMAKTTNNENVVLIPKFSNLSSGEIMIFSIFCSILKEYDRVSSFTNQELKDISGIVIIDEIDSHLHSNFIKEVLPKVMELFPNIQFIVSSHSPFYLLGMRETFKDRCTFLGMPNGNILDNVENFSEIQKCYEILDVNHKIIQHQLSALKDTLNTIKTPLIVTEGKTDWKHIKHALEVFKSRNEFLNLEIKFLEDESDMGDKSLDTFLKNAAKLPNNNKIIGIFDSDTSVGSKYSRFKNFGNNVFACCIPNPYEYECGISIELLYRQEDLKITDVEGRRLYLSDEFTGNRKNLKINNNIGYVGKIDIDELSRKGHIKIIDNSVFDNENNSLALSKSDYANNIYDKVAPFDKVNVDGFRELFNTISSIIS